MSPLRLIVKPRRFCSRARCCFQPATRTLEELHKAARAGDLKQVETLIADGVPVNARDSLGGTPLHDAAWAGEKDVAAYLIGHGRRRQRAPRRRRIDAAALRGDDQSARRGGAAARSRRGLDRQVYKTGETAAASRRARADTAASPHC